eukprot:jgi/Botrbrau1/2561/Bobra.0079s0047.1
MSTHNTVTLSTSDSRGSCRASAISMCIWQGLDDHEYPSVPMVATTVCFSSTYPQRLSYIIGTRSQPIQAQTPGNGDNHFVAVSDGNFAVGCETFYPAIYNQWEVVEMASGAPTLLGASLPPGVTGPELLRKTMDDAAAAGLTVLRFWTNGVTPSYAVQQSPGVYNEAMLRGLDYVLDEARKRNVKDTKKMDINFRFVLNLPILVIMVLLDNWQQTGGIADYIKWAKDPTLTHDDFYTNPQIQQWYKNYVRTLVNRVNTINGITYKDDPTIFSWELLNELRCTKCPPGTIANWIKENAAYLKSIDPNHLVGVGEEGFYSSTASRLTANPGADTSGWAAQEGQDFIADHSSPDIDYAAFHSWIDRFALALDEGSYSLGRATHQGFDFPLGSPWAVHSWAYPLGNVTEGRQRAWIDAHAQDGAILKKPILLEEFGKWLNATVRADMAQRNLYFRIIFDESNRLINAPGSYLKFYDNGQIGPVTEGGGQGLYGIYPTDQTFSLITEVGSLILVLSGPRNQSPDGTGLEDSFRLLPVAIPSSFRGTRPPDPCGFCDQQSSLRPVYARSRDSQYSNMSEKIPQLSLAPFYSTTISDSNTTISDSIGDVTFVSSVTLVDQWQTTIIPGSLLFYKIVSYNDGRFLIKLGEWIKKSSMSSCMQEEARFLNSKSVPVAGVCDPGANAANVQASPVCTNTQVQRLPGTGFEGPACNVDINECVRGTDNCAANATCINTNGAFQCKCWLGFSDLLNSAGDGSSCTPTAAIQQLRSQYTDVADQGPLICDIPYPMFAPGFQYDPTGALQRDSYESVAYSPGWQNCFLKGCPSKYAVTCPVFPSSQSENAFHDS